MRVDCGINDSDIFFLFVHVSKINNVPLRNQEGFSIVIESYTTSFVNITVKEQLLSVFENIYVYKGMCMHLNC